MKTMRVVGCCALVALAGLASCEREDAAGEALQKAHVKLASLSPSGTTFAAGKMKSKELRDVISSLKPALDGTGTETQKASAQLLVAQAELALAEPHAARAAELEKSVMQEYDPEQKASSGLSLIRSLLGQYRTTSAAADAAAGYSPSSELTELDRQKKEKEGEIAKANAAQVAIEKEVGELRGQARAKQDESRAKRQAAGSLRQKVANQSATEGEKTTIEAIRISREADGLDVAAAGLEAKAASIEPRIGEVKNTIERLTKQVELLEQERERVKKRHEEMQRQAAELRASAAKTGEEIRSLADRVHELREGELKTETEQAAAGFGKAASGAKGAAKELKSGASMVAGLAQQSMGDVQLGLARGLTVYAHVLESLTLAKPAVPGAEAFAARLSEAKAGAKAAVEAAFEAYKAADEAYKAADASYNAAGGGADVKAKLDRINHRLRELIKLSGGGDDVIEARGDAAPAETPVASGGETGAPAGDDSGPLATVKRMVAAIEAGDAATLESCFFTANESDKQTVRGMFGMMTSVNKLDHAMKAKFGTSLTEAGQSMGMGGMSGGMGGFDPKAIANATVKVEGDTATVSIPGDPDPTKMVRKDGKWLIDLSDQMAEMKQAAQMMGGFGSIFEEVAKDVESGKLADIQAAMMAIQQKIAAKMGLQGGGG